MRTIVIHAEGQACPAPVIHAARALEELREPGTVEVHVDNEAAVQNLTRLAGGKGLRAQTQRLGEGAFCVAIGVTEPLSREPLKEPMCSPAQTAAGWVAAVDADTMGRGDDALGRLLLKGFLFAMSRLPQVPKTLLFYNGGAKLTAQGSDSLEDLRELADRGTEILTCGTCLQHYGLPSPPAVGGVTNMYEIVERLTAADKVVKP